MFSIENNCFIILNSFKNIFEFGELTVLDTNYKYYY